MASHLIMKAGVVVGNAQVGTDHLGQPCIDASMNGKRRTFPNWHWAKAWASKAGAVFCRFDRD